MLNPDTTKISDVALHRVGNKTNDEGCHLSQKLLRLNDELKELLTTYFLMPFKSDEYYHFYHDTNLNMNEAFSYVADIFDNPEKLYEQSVNLAKHLYEKSVHPNIKGGDFYTVYFKDCMLDGETMDAVGLFKSENKDTFLKVLSEDDNFYLESEQGINIKKLDKGCLIFNTEREQGFMVSIVDNTNRGAEAQYWIEDFLHACPRQDEYFHTQNLMALTKSFVTKELPAQFDISRADQANLLNESVQFFKDRDNFTMEEFGEAVIQQPEVIESFQEYKDRVSRENDLKIPDSFDISDSAVKKQSRGFKSVIKLDKNFHIYVHGNRNLIEQGEDEKGKFYKVYYQEEN